MRKILAVAGLTFKESARRKDLLALFLCCIAVILIGAFVPVAGGPAGRMKLLLGVCLNAMGFFGALAAILVSSPSIPTEVSEKRIYAIWAKPVPRSAYLLGKILGFMALMVVLLFAMGVASVAFCRGMCAWLPAGSGAEDALTVLILGKGIPFEANLAKWLLVTLSRLLIVVSAGAMGSTFLSAPVAVLLASAVCLCGNSLEFLRNIAQGLAAGTRGLGGASAAAATAWDGLLAGGLSVVCTVFPDLARFDASAYVLKGLDVPAAVVVGSAAYAFLYAVPFFAAGVLALVRREVP